MARTIMMFFSEKNVQITKKLLEDLGFREMKHVNEPFKWFFRRVDSDLVMSIHLHAGVAWEGVKFVNENDFWLKHILQIGQLVSVRYSKS